ncbi:MAG: prolipoprotein diacylglyceryl transferase [Elusimicrobia bacterium]|nr:prolipoprotein diacylglyceryl transferase [Elusimicrobiota bacterium]
MHPILISAGRFQLSSYGAFAAAGYLAAILWLKSQMRAMGLDEKRFWSLIYWVFAGAVLGGKLMFWAVSYRELLDGRLALLADLRYGFVFYGGLLGALAAGWAAARRCGVPFLAAADNFAVALPLGHAVGRLGCLAAGCCYGRPTSLPWAVTLGGPGSSTPAELWGVPLHPVPLYESIANLAIAAFLAKVLLPRVRRRELAAGSVLAAYAGLYGAARFALEFLRYDDRGLSLPPFSISQWLSLAAVAAAAALFARRGLRTR